MKIADHAMPEMATRRAAYASHARSRRFRAVTDKGIDSISPPVTMRVTEAPNVIAGFATQLRPPLCARWLRGALQRPGVGAAGAAAGPLAIGGAAAGEAFWTSVRDQFVMPPDLAVMNAANLCPASRPALETLQRETQSVDRDPSPNNRARLYPEKENTRKALAEFLRVTPDEIIITRNTSESNNLVSNGLDLKAGDEVIVHADNHPSNLNAWREKGKRFGFSVVTVEQKNPHPGTASTTSTRSRARSRRGRRCCASRISRARSAI